MVFAPKLTGLNKAERCRTPLFGGLSYFQWPITPNPDMEGVFPRGLFATSIEGIYLLGECRAASVRPACRYSRKATGKRCYRPAVHAGRPGICHRDHDSAGAMSPRGCSDGRTALRRACVSTAIPDVASSIRMRPTLVSLDHCPTTRFRIRDGVGTCSTILIGLSTRPLLVTVNTCLAQEPYLGR